MAKIIIDNNKCKACGICMGVCPKKLIKHSSEQNKAGYFYAEFNDPNLQCLGCALCAENCPDMAICEVYK